jgi:hypothetical protein
MIRLLIRLMGLLLLAGGFVALIVDGTRSLAGGSLNVTSMAGALQGTAPLLYRSLQAAVQGNFPDFVWDRLLAFLVLVPLSAALGGLGALLIVLSHKQEATLGYTRD